MQMQRFILIIFMSRVLTKCNVRSMKSNRSSKKTMDVIYVR